MKPLIKVTIASIAFLILINFSASSQSNSSNKIDSTRRAQNIYLELGAVGLFVSVNYDTRFSQQRDGLGARLGIGYPPATHDPIFSIPFQLNYLIGKKSSFLELGAGATLLSTIGNYQRSFFGNYYYAGRTIIIPTTTIGYRHQPVKRGINYGVSFNPLLWDGRTVIPYFGLGVGYTIK